MAKITKTSEKVEIKIEDIKVKIQPLTYHQKNQIQAVLFEGQKEKDMVKLGSATVMAIKYCLKEVSGITDSNNQPYKLEFDEDGNLTESCLDDILNFEDDRIIKVCGLFINNVPKSFTIEGVSFVSDDKKKEA